MVDLKDTAPASVPKERVPTVVIPMPEPVVLPASWQARGEPDRISIYRNVDGDACFAIVRWETEAGKDVRPVVWNGTRFQVVAYPDLRPLYNSDIIATHPDATILLVEGEKTADAALAYMPDGWIVTTWAGGSNALNKSDWSVLHGRRVVIWPDNDMPGKEAAEAIAQRLRDNNTEVGVVSLSKNYPAKWDLADELPDGVSPVIVMANMIAAANNAVVRLPPSIIDDALEDKEDIPAPLPSIEECAEFKALGYTDKHFFIMPAGTKIILSLNARELMSASGCLQVVNDFDYWAEMFPAKRGSSSRADWEMAGSMIMRECQKVGVYDPRRVRGRGVWTDQARVVVHTGESLIVDGRVVNPVMMKSRFVYKIDAPLFVEGLNQNNAANDAEGRLVVELCNAARWEHPVFGDLLAGYIATAMVCGALHWRTHVWVTGNSGSGKSTVINNIVSACVGDMALYPLGETTESGIRQTIGNDARPVIFDEMEGTDERGPAGANRRNAIISLMRMASSEGRGRIMKGSASHQAVSFTMRSSFLVASIGMSLKEAPDLTRTMVLGLKPLMNDARPEERRRAQQQWEVMNRLASRVRTDMPERLFCRMTEVLPVLMKNAQVFREAIAEKMGNRRLGDQVGTLLAGRFALTTRKIFTVEECMEYLNRFDWVGVVATPGEREDIRLVNHIRQHVIKVQARHGNTVERTIGELIHVSKGTAVDDEVDSTKATGALSRMGIKADDAADVIWLSKQSQAIDAIMSKSTNPTDWASVVSRYPKAVKASYRIRFAAGSATAIGLPYSAWVD